MLVKIWAPILVLSPGFLLLCNAAPALRAGTSRLDDNSPEKSHATTFSSGSLNQEHRQNEIHQQGAAKILNLLDDLKEAQIKLQDIKNNSTFSTEETSESATLEYALERGEKIAAEAIHTLNTLVLATKTGKNTDLPQSSFAQESTSSRQLLQGRPLKNDDNENQNFEQHERRRREQKEKQSFGSSHGPSNNKDRQQKARRNKAQSTFRERFGAKHFHKFDFANAIEQGDHGFLHDYVTDMHQRHQQRQQQGSHYHRQRQRQNMERSSNNEGTSDFEETARDGYGQDKRNLLSTKLQKCDLLRSCVESMSMYDMVMYYHQDDINDDGTIDDNIQRFNEEDIMDRFDRAKDIVSRPRTNSRCNNLLQVFHRTIESPDGVGSWEGGTVSQVCLASQTTRFIRLEHLAKKISYKIATNITATLHQCSLDLYNAGDKQHPFPFGGQIALTPAVDYQIPAAVNPAMRDAHGQLLPSSQITNADHLFLYFDQSFVPPDSPLVGVDLGSINNACKVFCQGARGDFPQIPVDLCLDCGGFLDYIYQNDLDSESKIINGGWETLIEQVDAMNEARQYGFELVFGAQASIGFVCGITDAVVNQNKPMPGHCCAMAPYEESGAYWGSPHDCSNTCTNSAPFWAGLDPAACGAYGGNFCYNETGIDCSVLQNCVASMVSSSTNSAFVTWLEASPTIELTSDPYQCGEAREYFGFAPTYINDQDICDNVEELEYTRDFSTLDDLFGEGSSGAGCGGEYIDDGSTDIPLPVLQGPDTAALPGDGQAWRATSFSLAALAEAAEDVFELTDGVTCPCILGAGEACNAVKNVLLVAMQLVVVPLKTANAVSAFTYGELMELGNVEPAEIYQNTIIVKDNMDRLAVWMRDRFASLEGRLDQIIVGQESGTSTKTTPQATFPSNPGFTGPQATFPSNPGFTGMPFTKLIGRGGETSTMATDYSTGESVESASTTTTTTGDSETDTTVNPTKPVIPNYGNRRDLKEGNSIPAQHQEETDWNVERLDGLSHEINEIRGDVKRLQDDMDSIKGLLLQLVESKQE